MKRILSFGGLALCAMLTLASCDEQKPATPEETPDTPATPEDPSQSDKPTAELAPDEQKTKLESVATKVMDTCPANEFKKFADLGEKLGNSVYVSEDYDWGTIEDWFEDQLETAYKEDIEISFSKGVSTRNNVTEILILMSNHTGLFTLTENGLQISDYDGGTKAVFSLEGKNYEAEIRGEGKVTEAHFLIEDKSEGNYNYGYVDENGNWVSTDEPVITKRNYICDVTVGVPEKINIALTEDGAPLLTATATLTPSFTEEGVNLTTDSFSAVLNAAINDYEIVVEQVAYNGATGKAGYSQSFKKGGTTIYKTQASADLSLEITTETWEDVWGDNDRYYDTNEYTIVKAKKAKDIVASLDIMGELQVYGKCSNGIELYEEYDALWLALSDYDWEKDEEKSVNEDEAKRHLNNINAKIDFGVYYDGGSNRQATLEFELTYEQHKDEYGSWDDYDLIPVIVFNDGSRYSVEDYFTEDAFSSLIDTFEEFCESYEEVFAFE